MSPDGGFKEGFLSFNEDERRAQELAGLRAGRAAIRPFMPEQHRAFFPLLPYLFTATLDATGAPIASMLWGPAGFVHSPDIPQPTGAGSQFDHRTDHRDAGSRRQGDGNGLDRQELVHRRFLPAAASARCPRGPVQSAEHVEQLVSMHRRRRNWTGSSDAG